MQGSSDLCLLGGISSRSYAAVPWPRWRATVAANFGLWHLSAPIRELQFPCLELLGKAGSVGAWHFEPMRVW